MMTIETQLRKEVLQLEKIINQAQKRLQTVRNGFLRIKKKRGRVEYYFVAVGEKGGNGKYLKKRERGIAERIAQRDYDEKLIRNAEERIKAITTFIKKYDATSIQKIYAKTSPYRQELITNPVLPDEEYIKQWQAVEYESKAFADDAPEIITERGERVRSKSEKIIADKLYTMGIPYRYECPLILSGNVKLYPDFTILKMPERKEIYLEHLGMMDDENYIRTAMYKLSTYEKNNIYLGVNLFVSHETRKNPLNTRTLDGLLKNLFGG